MKRKIIYISILIIPAVLCVFLYKTPAPELGSARAKCPDDYANTDAGSAEYLADFNVWTKDFYNKNPQAGLADWSRARYEFWVENDCAGAIKRYNEAKNGTANEDQLKSIEKAIRQAL